MRRPLLPLNTLSRGHFRTLRDVHDYLCNTARNLYAMFVDVLLLECQDDLVVSRQISGVVKDTQSNVNYNNVLRSLRSLLHSCLKLPQCHRPGLHRIYHSPYGVKLLFFNAVGANFNLVDLGLVDVPGYEVKFICLSLVTAVH